MPDYRIDLKSSTGVRYAIITDFLRLRYQKEVNAPGVVELVLGGTHPALPQLVLGDQVEVWRRDGDAGLTWYCDAYALYEDDEAQSDDDGQDRVTLTCPGILSMLGWRINAYPAGTANKTLWTNVQAETLLKSLVTNNCTSSATTANGRDRDGLISGISVQANGAGGTSLSWERARSNLLRELQDIAQIAEGDFDLIPTGAASWDFRWYAGQRGSDRSSAMLFAQEYGNMRRPQLRRIRSTESTIAIVGGQDTGSQRQIAICTGPTYSVNRNREGFVDARQASTTAALQASGDQRLIASRWRTELDWDIVQTASSRYGRDYGLGDLVRGRYRGIEAVKKIQRVSIAIESDGREHVQIETSDP